MSYTLFQMIPGYSYFSDFAEFHQTPYKDAPFHPDLLHQGMNPADSSLPDGVAAFSADSVFHSGCWDEQAVLRCENFALPTPRTKREFYLNVYWKQLEFCQKVKFCLPKDVDFIWPDFQ